MPKTDKQKNDTLSISFEIVEVTTDEVQDMLPQNMAHWHIEYFKLKELEKMAKAGRSL